MNVLTYLLYVVVTTIIIIYIGNACYNNGKIFISNYFPEDLSFANGINNVLRVAYYLLNLGLLIWTLHSLKEISSIQLFIEEVSERLGRIFLIIALLHGINLITIFIGQKYFKNN